MTAPAEPAVSACAVSADARGEVLHCNPFDMAEVRRFYCVKNSPGAPVRGWIAHLRETKWFFPLRGETTIHFAPCPDPEAAPPDESRVRSISLSASSPAVLRLPSGNALAIEQHGGAEVMVFSDVSADASGGDTWRFPFGGTR